MVVDRNIYVMLVAEDRFRATVDGETRSTTTAPGFVTGPSAGSAREVDETVAKAIAVGGKAWPIMEDRPFYSGSFQDADGRAWQLTYRG